MFDIKQVKVEAKKVDDLNVLGRLDSNISVQQTRALNMDTRR